jgi:hypothetical protein
MLTSILLTAVLLTLSFAALARAHYVWLERDSDGPARAYLGEWIDDIREKTGGMLDRIKAPRVFLGANSEPLPIKRNDNNLEFQAKERGDVRLVEDSMPAREDKEKGGITKTIYYAKAGRSATAARLTWTRAHRAECQYLAARFSRRAAAENRSHHHRSSQVAEAFGHQRQRPDQRTDAVGWAVRAGSHPFRRERWQRQREVQSHAPHLLAVIRAARRYSLD